MVNARSSAGRGRLYGTLPPWQASKVRTAKVNTLLHNLKVPNGWPTLPSSLAAMSTMKLEQSLAFAGDTGRYLIELLDIDAGIHGHMHAPHRWTFLKNMHRSSVALWPSYSQSPFAVIPKTYVVVQHTATVLDGDADNLHDSGSDDGGKDEYKADL